MFRKIRFSFTINYYLNIYLRELLFVYFNGDGYS